MDILQFSDVILLSFAFLVLVISTITDIKRREVPNWISFSFLGFVIFIKIITFLFSWNYSILINAGIYFIVFFILGNLLYYGQVFGGGDIKLLYGLSIAFSSNPFFYSNQINNFNEPFIMAFIINSFIIGAIYGILFSIFIVTKNEQNLKRFKLSFRQGLKKQEIGFKILLWICVIISLIFLIMGFVDSIFFLFFVFVLIIPFLFLFEKIVEQEFMIKEVYANNLTEGDWLVKKMNVLNRIIKPNVHGLNIREINYLKKNYRGKVKIKDGLPFVPGFLISLILTIFVGDLLFKLVYLLV